MVPSSVPSHMVAWGHHIIVTSSDYRCSYLWRGRGLLLQRHEVVFVPHQLRVVIVSVRGHLSRYCRYCVVYRYSATAHRVPVLDVEVARGAGLWAGLRRAALAAHPAPAWQVDGT